MSTTTRPRALRSAVVALGVCLFTLAALNLYIVGRSATDENLFMDPLSRVYVVEEVHGALPDTAVAPLEGALSAFIPRQPINDTRLEPGDVLIEVDDVRVRGTGQVRDLVSGDQDALVVAFRGRAGQTVAVRVAAPELRDAIRSIENTVLVVQVTPGGASDRAGMRAGDLITRINGQGFSSATDADRVMRQSQAGRVSTYDVLRGGEPLGLEVRLAAFGIGIGPLLLCAVGLFYIVSGTMISSMRPSIKAARYLGLAWMGTGFALAVALNRQRRSLPPWYQYSSDLFLALSVTLGIAVWLHALHYFPRERRLLIERRWAKYGGYALALALACVTLGVTWTFDAVDGLFVPAAVIMLTYASVAAARTRRGYGAEDRQLSRPTAFVTTAAVITILSIVVVGALRALFTNAGGINATVGLQVGIALLFLVVLAVHLLVIGRYRLLDLDLRVRRNVQYLFVSSAWTAVVVALGVGAWWWMTAHELPLPNIRLTGDAIEVLPTPIDPARRAEIEKGVLIAAAVVLAFGFRALFKQGHRFLAEQYYQEGFDYRRATQELSDVMGPRMDLDGLADGLLTVLDRQLPVERAGIVFVQGPRLVPAKRSTGFEPEEWEQFCSQTAEEAVEVVRAAKGTEVDREYAPPRLRLALRRAQVHHLYPIGGHNTLHGVLFIGEKLSQAPFTADDFAFLGVIGGQAALHVENAFLYENLAAQERARQELEIARRIQLESLPQRPPSCVGLEVAAKSVPALEVGGDYFDYLPDSDTRLGVMIGDVSGKGTSAALYMSKLQGIVRSLHAFGLKPQELFVRTNQLLGRDMEKRAFVTTLGAFFDTQARTVTVARAGHLPLYHYQAASGHVARVLPRGLGLGLASSHLFESELGEQCVSYDRGDLFLMVTDGVTESQGTDREEFGEERLLSLFSELASRATPVADIVSAIIEAVDAFEGAGQHDDETVIVIRAV